MAELLPVNFLIPGESAIASYNYTDLAEGTGIIKFYGFAARNSAAYTYHLDKNPTYSALIQKSGAWSNSSSIDIDFDTSTFNTPCVIKGTAIINMTLSVIADAGHTSTGYITAYVRKWNGTTETEIANVQSANVVDNDATANKEVLNLRLTIPQTSFKRGETLRLTIVLSGSCPSGTGVFAFGCDPMNRDADEYSGWSDGVDIKPSTDSMITQLNFYCPFKIDK